MIWRKQGLKDRYLMSKLGELVYFEIITEEVRHTLYQPSLEEIRGACNLYGLDGDEIEAILVNRNPDHIAMVIDVERFNEHRKEVEHG